MNLFKKIFASVTVLAMAVMTVAPAGFAHAQTVSLSAGDLIKASGAAVYYYAGDGKRYVFPNEKTYKTWYMDFSGVKTISDSQLASISIGGNIVFRPGTNLVKITTDPKVYAVGPGGTLHWVPTEADAKKFFGDNWASWVLDVPDAFFTNYTVSSTNVGPMHPDGALISYKSDPSKTYVIWNGQKRLITSNDAMMANRFNSAYVIMIDDSVTYSNGPEVTGGEAALTDSAQLGSAPVQPVGGALTVSVAAETPAAQDIPAGANNPATDVQFAILNLTTGNAAVQMNGLSIHRSGLSVNSDLSSVKLYDGQMNRLGTPGTFNADDKVKFSFSRTIPANTTWKVIVAADNAAGKTGRIKMGVMSATDINSNASSVQGTFPMYGNTMVQVNVDVGTLSVSTGPNNPNTAKEIDVDSVQERFMQVKLTAGSTEKIRVKSLTFEKGDNATFSLSDLTNYKLINDGTAQVVATGTVDGDFVRFDINPNIILDKGDSVTLSLRADVIGGAGDIATFSLIDSDSWLIYAVGEEYGFGSAFTPAASTGVNFGSGTATEAETANITISKGKVVVSKGPNSPAVGEIAKGADEVSIGSFNFNVKGEAVKTDKITIDLTCGGGLTCNANTHVSLFRLVDGNGKLFAGPFDPVAGNKVEFSDQIELPIGDTELFVKADVADGAPDGGTIRAEINPSTDMSNVKGLNSNKSITATPNAQLTANTQTIDSAKLTVSPGGTPANNTKVVKGAICQPVGSITLDASDGGEDVKLTSVKVTRTGGTESLLNLSNFKLIDGDDCNDPQVGETEQATSATEVTFNIDNGFPIPRSSAKLLTIVADAVNVGTNSVQLRVNATGDIVGVGVDSGVTLATADKTVNTPTPTTVTFAVSGLLKVVLDADTPVDHLVQAGVTGHETTKYKFSAIDEDVDVKKVTLYGANQKTSTTTDGANVDTNVKMVKLYDGATLLGSGIFSSGTATINIPQGKFRIAKDDDKVMTVKVDLQPKETLISHNAGGADTTLSNDQRIHIGIATVNTGTGANEDGNNWGSTGDFSYNLEAVGVGSGEDLADPENATTADQTCVNSAPSQGGACNGLVSGGNFMRTFDGILTLAKNPGLLSSGSKSATQEILRVDLTASGDDITIQDIGVVITNNCTGGGAGTGPATWKDLAGNTTYHTVTAAQVTAATILQETDGFNWQGSAGSALQIAKGTTKTVKLEADTTLCNASNDDSLQARIIAGTYDSGTTLASGIRWTDDSLDNTGANFVDDPVVDDVPVDGPSFTY